MESFLNDANCPVPTPYFTGRAKKLNKLDEFYKSKTPQIIAITGIGGIGKTELANRFANSIQDVHPIWLSFSDIESSVYIQNNLVTWLNNLPQDWARCSNAIAVIDGVSFMAPWILTLIPALAQKQNCTIIITTVLQDLSPLQVNVIRLTGWERYEVEAYVKVTLRSTIPLPEELKELYNHLHGYPLAIQQAMCYILHEQLASLQGKSYGLSHFLKDFKTKGVSIFNFLPELETYKNTTLTAWDVELYNVKSKHGDLGAMAYAIIQILGLLGCMTIRKSGLLTFIEAIYMGQNISSDFHKSLELLERYSLIETSDTNVSVHGLFLMVIHHKMKTFDTNRTEGEKMKRFILQNLDFTRLSKHEVRAVTNFWEECSTNQCLVLSYPEFPDSLFNKLIELSLFELANEFAESNVSKFANMFGKRHLLTTIMSCNIAIAHLQRDNHQQCVDICKRIFAGEGCIEISLYKKIRHILQLFIDKGLLREGTGMGKFILSSLLKKTFENTLETIRLGIFITSLIKKQGEFKDAIQFCNEMIDSIKINSGSDWDLCLLKLRYKRAVCLFHEKRFKESSKEFKEVVIGRSVIVGRDNVETLKAKYWMILSMMELELNDGGLKKAENLLKSLLTLCENVLGDHKLTRKIQTSIEHANLDEEFVFVDNLSIEGCQVEKLN